MRPSLVQQELPSKEGLADRKIINQGRSGAKSSCLAKLGKRWAAFFFKHGCVWRAWCAPPTRTTCGGAVQPGQLFWPGRLASRWRTPVGGRRRKLKADKQQCHSCQIL